jgi:hypothetical protein
MEAFALISNRVDLMNKMLQACLILQQQCQPTLVTDPTTGITYEMDEEEQNELKGMSTKSFREMVEDTYLQVMLYLTQVDTQNGLQNFMQLIDHGDNSCPAVDSKLFTLRSVEIALQDEPELQVQNFITFFFQKILDKS